MLKECKVLLNNESVTVIRYDDILVQIPAIGRKADVVKVKDDGHYTVVPDDYGEQVEKKMKTRKKKTPVVSDEQSESKEE